MDESFDLQGRVAVVTGASAGIGAACARRLAARGCDLALGARRTDRLAALAEELERAHGVCVLVHALDVRERASVAAFGAAADAFAGTRGVHLLVNNAGMAQGISQVPAAGPAEEDAWEAMLDTNVLGKLRVLRHFIGGMVARDAGHVVLLGSRAALEAYEGGTVYCATKAAVRIAARALRLELFGTRVRVCCIHPGMVETEFSKVRLGSQEQADAVYAGMTPLTGDDVARVVEWVATLPAHVNIDEVTLMPTDQVAVRRVHRRPAGGS
jgi:NADP-dependent 3-hydroxy acid dehydrogenase YdfG